MNDTYWEHNGQRITLDDVKRFIEWHKLITQSIPVASLLALATSPSAQHHNSASHEPIIVIARNSKPVMVLDGHHRVQQAFRAGDSNISGYIIDIQLVPLEWRSAVPVS